MAAIDVNKQSPNKVNPEMKSNNTSEIIQMLQALRNSLDVEEPIQTDWTFELNEVVKSILNENIKPAALTDSQGSSTDSDVLSQESAGVDLDAEYQYESSVTAIRVSGPKKLRSHQKAIIRQELRALMMCQVEGNEGELMQIEESSLGPAVVSMEDVDSKLGTITERLTHQQQECAEVKQHIKDMQLASEIYALSRQSKVLQAMFDTPPTPPEQTDRRTGSNLLDSVQISSKLFT